MKKILVSAVLASVFALSASAGVIITDTLGIRTAASDNVAELLRGQVAGVRVSSIDGNPVGGVNVNIRGVNSLRTDNQPLWIIDGAMVSTDLNENLDAFWQYGERSYTAPLNPLAFLNANEIESIEVLKDISATTIYGERGANGVIIVKTRMPSSGERNFLFSTNAGISTDACGLGLKPSFSHNHYLGVNGTAANTSYNISGTFRVTDGIMTRNSSTYGSVKANFETRANNVLWFGLNAVISAGKSSSPSGVAYLGRPSATLALRDASLSPGTSASEWADDYDDDTEDYRSLISTYIRFNFSPSLYAKVSGGMDYQHNKRIIWYGRGTEFGACSSENQYGGAAGVLVSQLLGYNTAAELTLNRFFASRHHIKATLSAEYLGNMNKFNTLNGINFVSHKLRGKGLETGAYETRLHKFFRNYSHFGGYAAAAYDYDGIFGISAAYRTDWSPKYLDREINSYPSVEAFLDIRKAFFSNSGLVSSLKAEAGYGESGREEYVPYELFENYLSGGWFVPEPGTSTFYDGLDKLRTKEFHIGFRSGILGDRFTLGISWFDRATDDIFRMYRLGNAPEEEKKTVWQWGGCEMVFDRVSCVTNNGYEFETSLGIIRSRDWKWDVRANVTYSGNRVTSSNSNDFYGRKVGSGIFCTCNSPGAPVSTLFGYQTGADGKIEDLTGDGRINEADLVTFGNTIPRVYGGLQSTLSFKNLTMELLLDGAAGHKVANLNSLVKEGVKGPDGVIVLTSNFVEKGDYLRVSQIGFRYRVPLESKTIKALDLRASIHNPITFSAYKGWNPDTNCFGVSTLANGLDYGSYPVSRMFLIGASLKF